MKMIKLHYINSSSMELNKCIRYMEFQAQMKLHQKYNHLLNSRQSQRLLKRARKQKLEKLKKQEEQEKLQEEQEKLEEQKKLEEKLNHSLKLYLHQEPKLVNLKKFTFWTQKKLLMHQTQNSLIQIHTEQLFIHKLIKKSIELISIIQRHFIIFKGAIIYEKYVS